MGKLGEHSQALALLNRSYIISVFSLTVFYCTCVNHSKWDLSTKFCKSDDTKFWFQYTWYTKSRIYNSYIFFYQYLIFIAAICERGCGPFATCVKPGRCRCKKGYVGKKCRKKVKHECLRYCMKSCPSGNCTCPKYGKSCEKGKYCFQKWIRIENKSL